MSLADVQQLVDDLVRDTDQVISSTARDTAIELAVVRYSSNAPRRVVEDVVAGAASALPAPAGWVAGESELQQIEWPVGRQPRAFVPLELVLVETTPDGVQFEQLAGIGAGQTVRLTFTGTHMLTATADTIPLKHRHAVACLAAADLCGQLAAHYSNEGAPTLPADTVDHKGKSDRWRARQRDLLAEYKLAVGAAPNDRTKAASAEVTPPRRTSLGHRRMFHPPTDWPRS